MADFAAVLKKTIDAQANPDQALRQRVYAKARSTIEQKLEAANAPDAVAQRQRQILETAIEDVEAEYRAAERALAEAEQPEQTTDPLEDFLKAVQDAGVVDEHNADPETSVLPEIDNDTARDDWQHSDKGDGDLDHDRTASYQDRNLNDNDDDRHERGRSKALIVGLAAALLVGGAGFAGWKYQDQVKDYVSSLTSGAGDTGEGTDAGEDEENDITGDGNAVTTPPADKPEGEQKLTQRLLPDGNEVDEGSAGDAPKIGEGTSNAPVTGTAPAGTGQSVPATNTPAQTVPVGQRAFFYEEQRSGETSAAATGSVVWSVVQDSPGEGAPDEPAIRADANFPDAKVSLRMTIRRNADQSIPASHLIEMIYTVPDDFSGGVIENVQRVTFKDSEQAAGNPLAAIPMKIADNFFLVALNDARTAVDMNLSLMRRQQWIDIPITYRNGRRALISIDKGVPGDKVFDEVLKSWGNAAPAAN
ncbi:transcriptional regulator [Pseudochrobactrum sp. MP213Fo]|uniref:transcriptional regulator n=1 Tax=Pseudochrobactrum sp. MP213Fo TaxID=3022250 RepID=UPI003BA0CB03